MIREGEYSRAIYLILEGRFALSSAGADGSDLPIAVLRRGEYMGEQGMLTGQTRNATARAQTAAVVLEVPEQVMQRMMELVPAVQRFFEQLNDARSIESILKRMALFQGIPGADIRLVAEQTAVKRYDRDERLFAEGGTGGPAARFDAHHPGRLCQSGAPCIAGDRYTTIPASASWPTARAETTSRVGLTCWAMVAPSA